MNLRLLNITKFFIRLLMIATSGLVYAESDFSKIDVPIEERPYKMEIYVPSSRVPANGYPVLIGLSGSGTTDAWSVIKEEEAKEAADQYGFILVAASSDDGTYSTTPNVSETEEAKYVLKILQELQKNHAMIDDKNVFIAGYSGGGRTAYHVSCQTAVQAMYKFKGVITFGATQRYDIVCKDVDDRIHYRAYHVMNDKQNDWSERHGNGGRPSYTEEYGEDAWMQVKAAHDCDERRETVSTIPGSNGETLLYEAQNCSHETSLVLFKSGGHAVHGDEAQGPLSGDGKVISHALEWVNHIVTNAGEKNFDHSPTICQGDNAYIAPINSHCSESDQINGKCRWEPAFTHQQCEDRCIDDASCVAYTFYDRRVNHSGGPNTIGGDHMGACYYRARVSHSTGTNAKHICGVKKNIQSDDTLQDYIAYPQMTNISAPPAYVANNPSCDTPDKQNGLCRWMPATHVNVCKAICNESDACKAIDYARKSVDHSGGPNAIGNGTCYFRSSSGNISSNDGFGRVVYVK